MFLQKQRNKSKIPQLKSTIVPLQTTENEKRAFLLGGGCYLSASVLINKFFRNKKKSVAKYELSSLQHSKILPMNAAILRGKSIDFYFVIF